MNGNQSYRSIVNAWLKQICSSIYVDLATGEVSLKMMESSTDTSSEIYNSGCVSLLNLIHHTKKIIIYPVPSPMTSLPDNNRMTVGRKGGGITQYLLRTKENIGDIINSMASRVFIDISNNNGQSYSHGAPMWVVLAHELVDGHAYHAANGTLGNDDRSRENQAIECENKYRIEHNLSLRPSVDWEDEE